MSGENIVAGFQYLSVGISAPPDFVDADRGSESDNAPFRLPLLPYGTEALFISPHHPQANSSERTIQKVKSRLRLTVAQRQHDWDAYVPLIPLQLNILPNRMLACTPFYLMFGTCGITAHHNWVARVRGVEDGRDAVPLARR